LEDVVWVRLVKTHLFGPVQLLQPLHKCAMDMPKSHLFPNSKVFLASIFFVKFLTGDKPKELA